LDQKRASVGCRNFSRLQCLVYVCGADGRRVRWVSGTPGMPPEYAGTDFVVARDGKIAALYMFLDKLP